jgi:PPOX class probable F420-dependent enzyme
VPRSGDQDALRERVAAAPVARLATLRPDGGPRLVPITFALVGGLVCSAVDEVKPKSGARLARLDDVAREPRAAVLVDHYTEDWAQLWWVRVDGTMTVIEEGAVHGDGALRERALDALAEKYPPYRASRPAGPLLVLTPQRWTGWSAR